MKLAIQDTKLNIPTAFNSTTSSSLTMQGVIPSEKQQHSYNVRPGLQRTVTTELLIEAGVPSFGLLIASVKGVSFGLS